MITATEIGGTGIGLVPTLFQGLLLVTGEGPAQGLLRVTVGGTLALFSDPCVYKIGFCGCISHAQHIYIRRCSAVSLL